LKQGRDACEAVSLPKEKLERAVIDQLRARVLTEKNLEDLVTLVNEELQAASFGLKDKLDCVDAELQDVKARLGCKPRLIWRRMGCSKWTRPW